MKRVLCFLLVLIMIFSLSMQAFADNDVLYCRICGRKIPTDSLVCPYCGEKVVHVDEEDAAKPSGSAPVAASPAPATDVKTALSQSSAPSPTTQNTAVPGPFKTAPGTSTTSSPIRVTKSPISETVPYGGSCFFIAHADNDSSVTWYIANGDASIICAASDAPSSNPGLCVSGANSDTLYLSGIPSWWNGFQVQACFNGEGGPVYSEVARIWTYQPYVQPTRCYWSYWDWINYYYYPYVYDTCWYWDYPYAYDPCWYWDYPYVYDDPAWYWDVQWDDEPNPPDVAGSITLPGGASAAPEKPGPGIIYEGDEAVVEGHTHVKTPTASTSSRWSIGSD